MLALQTLGEQLVALSDAQLRQVPLDERMQEAVALARRITSREGRRRQLQFIGRLMRETDPAPIRDAIRAVTEGGRQDARLLHAAEQWRDRLMDDPAALIALRSAVPSLDATDIATLADHARLEHQAGRHGRRYRELYRVIRAALSAGAASTQQEESTT